MKNRRILVLIVATCIGLFLAGGFIVYQSTQSGDISSPEQNISMPGSGLIKCDHPGIYKIYFKWNWKREKGFKPATVHTDSGLTYQALNEFVDKLFDVPQRKEQTSIQSNILCQIEANDRKQPMFLDLPLEGKRGARSGGGGSVVISYGTFVAPRAGLYTISSHAIDTTCGPYTLAILPEGWSEWTPLDLDCSARFIPKGTELTAGDLERYQAFGYKGSMQYPNNIVTDKLQIIGSRTTRDIWPKCFIRYSDIEMRRAKVVCASKDIAEGKTIDNEDIFETYVKQEDLPSQFHSPEFVKLWVSQKYLNEKETTAGVQPLDPMTYAGDWLPDNYATSKDQVCGRVCTGAAKGQLIVHRMKQRYGLGGADLLSNGKGASIIPTPTNKSL